MKLIVIRHGEADYTPCEERNFFGLGKELAPLTELGRRQAEEAAADPRLKGAGLIVSSAYTRALQTAAIISRITNIPLTVEVDLHEWFPDIDFMYKTKEECEELIADFADCRGRWPDGETRRWETIDMMSERLTKVLLKYLSYDKIVIVTHGMLMNRLKPYRHIPNCFVDEIDVDESFSGLEWYDDPEAMSTG